MKKIITNIKSTVSIACVMMLIFTGTQAFAGIPGYYFQELLFEFSGDNSILASDQSRPYGMVVDPDGKYWFGFYSGYSNEVVRVPGDTVRLAGIRCFLSDGTEAPFSPLGILEFADGSKDTLDIDNDRHGYCRGISIDGDGNILYTAKSTLYKIDYRDGSAIAKWDPLEVAKPLRTHVAAVHDSSSGYIYFAPYAQNEQLHILDEDLIFVAAAMDRTPTLQNAIEVRTKDNGVTQLFSATHSNGQGIFVYESSDPSTQPFTLVDTIGNYSEETDTNIITYIAWPTSLDWIDKEEGILLFGNHHKAMTTVNTGTAPASSHAARWVAINVDTDEILYMFGAPWYDIVQGDAVAKEVDPYVPENYLQNQIMTMQPSGALIRGDGDNYEFTLTDMGLNCVQVSSFSTALSDNVFIPYNLNLEQNYPNPFNPMTTIYFSLEQSESVILEIHDLTGRKVKQVFSGYLESGTHNMILDASNLPSGTYIYTLHTHVMSISRKMTVLK